MSTRFASVRGAMIKLNIKETAEREGIKNANLLSEATGLPYETCRKLWRGEARRIDLSTIERLCDVLHVRPSQLIDYEFEPDKPKRKRKARS
jgi:DNA-binding Xre family transcriptional regulator